MDLQSSVFRKGKVKDFLKAVARYAFLDFISR
jgi:hypothetical protein